MATAREIAAAAGVSESTVSRALAGSPMVARATVERIRLLAQEMGHRPRRSARARPRRTGTIGLVGADLANPFFASIAKAVQARASARGYRLLVADSNEDSALEVDIISDLTSHVDGLVLSSPRAPQESLAAAVGDLAVATTSRQVEGLPGVGVDDASAVEKVLAHLRALGHTHVAYVGGPAGSTSEVARSEALRRAAGAGGPSPTPEVTFAGHVQPFAVGGVSIADQVLSTGVSAVMAFNDLVAIGLMSRISQRRLRVPEDISVTGCDDILLAETTSPPLTTIAMPLARLGTSALDLVARWLDDGERPDSPPPLTAELIVRGSTGVARPRA